MTHPVVVPGTRPLPDAGPDRLAAAGLRLQVSGGTAVVHVERPPDGSTWPALLDVGRSLTGEVRAVVLRSAPGALAVEPDPGEQVDDAALALRQEALGWLRRPDLVSVAVLAGAVRGAGVEVALACDLRLAAEDVVLDLPQVAAGTVPHLGGTAALAELVGPARALELCLTGRRVAAAQAQAWGLVTLAVPAADLDGAATDLLAALLGAPRAAVAETKSLLHAARSRSRAEQCEAERTAQLRCLRDLRAAGHDDADETGLG